MPLNADDLVSGLRASRKFFLKHLVGLKLEQWDWKPYHECKSIRETIGHLVSDDRAALDSMQTGREPDYDQYAEEMAPERLQDLGALMTRLERSHSALCQCILDIFAESAVDAPICIYGTKYKMAIGVAYLSAEDYYHAGQVAFIRMASDPNWDYYRAVYGA